MFFNRIPMMMVVVVVVTTDSTAKQSLHRHDLKEKKNLTRKYERICIDWEHTSLHRQIVEQVCSLFTRAIVD